MNRNVLRTLDTDHIPAYKLVALLETFGLKHAARSLPDLLDTAEKTDATNKENLWNLFMCIFLKALRLLIQQRDI